MREVLTMILCKFIITLVCSSLIYAAPAPTKTPAPDAPPNEEVVDENADPVVSQILALHCHYFVLGCFLKCFQNYGMLRFFKCNTWKLQ